MTSILTEIMGLLTGGISGIASGIGSGLNDLVQKMFIVEPSTSGGSETLSVFGGVIAIFAGIGLAVGLSRKVFGWLVTLGGRK